MRVAHRSGTKCFICGFAMTTQFARVLLDSPDCLSLQCQHGFDCTDTQSTCTTCAVTFQDQTCLDLKEVVHVQFPLCNNAHVQHNKDTGDNVGPLYLDTGDLEPDLDTPTQVESVKV